MVYFIVLFTTIFSGLVQGVTGFGGGIVSMLVFPHFFGIPLGAGISVSLGIAFCSSVVYRYRKDVDVKMAILPAILFNIVCGFAISWSTVVEPETIKRIFGVFLLILAFYYLVINKNVKNRKLGIAEGLLCIVISAVCDGMFGIGGPLMVLYFMGKTDSPHAYLGTMQLFFWCNSVYNTAFRFYKGILLPEHLMYIAFGMAGILIGGAIAGKIVDRLNAAMMRKLVYAMIGVSGVVNLIG